MAKKEEIKEAQVDKNKDVSENACCKKCFIITPIGKDNSDIRRQAEGLLTSVIGPVLKEFDYDLEVAHRIDSLGSITNQIIEHILYDQLAIADLTGLNPNVMYELAVRHATGKPVICLAEEGTNLPFDVIGERTIFYTNDMKGVEDLKNSLTKMIKVIPPEDKVIDNPIYRVAKEKMIIKNLGLDGSNSPESDAIKFIVSELTNMNSKIDRLSVLENKPSFDAPFISCRILIKRPADVIKSIVSQLHSFLYKMIKNGISFDDSSISISIEPQYVNTVLNILKEFLEVEFGLKFISQRYVVSTRIELKYE
ncbi:hypothetical protein [Prevotella sp. 10(H)]|uniref:hypothetical protein n=1 Tax=Prevotella sp. 10(H) TaxID=1158294 RepID=UPI0004A74CF1|nr:hypothetical protein [Prevotella sp. 10(H)]